MEVYNRKGNEDMLKGKTIFVPNENAKYIY
jgi:hypothetical protein